MNTNLKSYSKWKYGLTLVSEASADCGIGFPSPKVVLLACFHPDGMMTDRWSEHSCNTSPVTRLQWTPFIHLHVNVGFDSHQLSALAVSRGNVSRQRISKQISVICLKGPMRSSPRVPRQHHAYLPCPGPARRGGRGDREQGRDLRARLGNRLGMVI